VILLKFNSTLKYISQVWTLRNNQVVREPSLVENVLKYA